MTDAFWNVCCYVFIVMVFAAWRTLPLWGIVLLVDLVFGRRISPRFQCVLWLLVVARLALPFSMESPVSVACFADTPVVALIEYVDALIYSNELENQESTTEPEGEFEIATLTLNSGEKVSVPVLPDDVSPEVRQSAEAYAAIVHQQRIAKEAAPPVAKTEMLTFDWEETLIYSMGFVWFTVAVAIISRSIYLYSRFGWHIRRSPEFTDPHILICLQRVCEELHLKRIPLLRSVELVSVPAVFGVWKPVICLPAKSPFKLSKEEMSWVLRHEIAHIKQRDTLVLAIASLIRAVHWMNPFAWLVVSKLNSSIEQAADELATRRMEPIKLLEYGRLLLRYASVDLQSDNSSVLGMLSIALWNRSRAGSRLRNRVERLGQAGSSHCWRGRAACLAFLVLVGLSGLTDAPNTTGWNIAAIVDQFDADSSIEDSNEFQNVTFQSGVLSTSPSKADAIAKTKGFVSPNESNKTPDANTDGTGSEEARLVELNIELAFKKAKLLKPEINEESFVRDFLKVAASDAKIVKSALLVASMTPTQEASCIQAIQMCELAFEKQIVLSIRNIQADVSLGAGFEWKEETNAPAANSTLSQSNSTISTMLSEVDFLLFLYRCQKSKDNDILCAPKVTLFSGQCAKINCSTSQPLATGIRSVSDEIGTTLQPVTESIEEGFEVQCKATAYEDDAVDLNLTLIESKIGDIHESLLPIKSTIDPKKFITVQVPSMKTRNVTSNVRIPKNQSLLIACPLNDLSSNRVSKEALKSMVTFYLISAEVIDESPVLE